MMAARTFGSEISLCLSTTLDDSQLKVVAEILCQEWGGKVTERLQKLVVNTPTARSFVMISKSQREELSACEIIGHVDIKPAVKSSTQDTVGSGTANAVLTSVIIRKDKRRQGFGKILMEKVEEVALQMKYGYIYLWTNDAVDFYKGLGYLQCESVSMDVAALKIVNESSLEKLENIFSRRFSIEQTGQSLASMASGSNTSSKSIWLRKRISRSLAVVGHVDTHSVTHEIREAVNRIHGKGGCSNRPDGTWDDRPGLAWGDKPWCGLVWEQMPSMPWAPQIGPSCGIAVLTMALANFALRLRSQHPCNYHHHLHHHQQQQRESVITDNSTTTPSINSEDDDDELEQIIQSLSNASEFLLATAIECNFSADGEIFNIEHLRVLAERSIPRGGRYRICATLVEAAVGGISPPEALVAHFIKGRLLIMPYDRDQAGNGPCEAGGAKAHYGLVAAYSRITLRGTSPSPSLSPAPRGGIEGGREEVEADVDQVVEESGEDVSMLAMGRSDHGVCGRGDDGTQCAFPPPCGKPPGQQLCNVRYITSHHGEGLEADPDPGAVDLLLHCQGEGRGVVLRGRRNEIEGGVGVQQQQQQQQQGEEGVCNLVACVQGMGPRPVVGSISEWLRSNEQLFSARNGGSASAWRVDRDRGPSLAGQCLLLQLEKLAKDD